ncbi:UNVERIFIED_CONTAM: hypothetical protein Sradi_7018500 [Sesamum radiatum]|uniref:Retrotransposon gag domain-containing protein n=1 Tax=Sesamum radiatum TaxID=300843 RepID=A0AAW2JBG6_SESRA
MVAETTKVGAGVEVAAVTGKAVDANAQYEKDVLYLHPSDHLGMTLASMLSDGTNCFIWSHAVFVSLGVKLKLGFIDETFPRPAEQFFAFYQVAPESRLDMISFYMHGDALSWFKWMFNNRQLSSWDAFVRSLELRFGPSSFDNHQAMLFKLRQYGTVTEYQTEFERICNRVVGLSPESILNYFISGLRPDIQRELSILQPSSISQAVGLAKLIEAKYIDARRSAASARVSGPQLCLPC